MRSRRKQREVKRHPPEWAEALNRAILESALDCIITMDASGRVREFNPAAERVFGFSRAEAVGKELAELIIPSRMREQHRRGLAHYLKTGEGPLLGKRIEIAALRRDGSEILVELAIAAYKIEGSPVFTAYLRDMTERLRNDRRRIAQYNVASLLAGSSTLAEAGAQLLEIIASSGDWVFGAIWLHDKAAGGLRCRTVWHPAAEGLAKFAEFRRIQRELQREKENAEAANAAKDKFLATLSHELRTPLTPVLIWAGGTLNQSDLNPEIKEGLQMVCRNVELEARLIDDLLDLTRISRGKLQLQLQAADAHELLQHALEIVRRDIEDRHLELSVSLEASSHDVMVDPPRLQQVFWNVLRNACKFTPDHGTVSVRSHNPSPKSITVEISDTGVGIEPQFLDKIFDAFEQIDSHREGLGLGLAISKAIIEMHGGSVRAHSEGLGKGATFVIDLPLDRTH